MVITLFVRESWKLQEGSCVSIALRTVDRSVLSVGLYRSGVLAQMRFRSASPHDGIPICTSLLVSNHT